MSLKMAKKNKSSQQRKHLKRRLYERYGVQLTEELYIAWKMLIRGGRAKLKSQQSLRVCIYEVPLGDKMVEVVYDKLRHTIVTVFPEEEKKS